MYMYTNIDLNLVDLNLLHELCDRKDTRGEWKVYLLALVTVGRSYTS